MDLHLLHGIETYTIILSALEAFSKTDCGRNAKYESASCYPDFINAYKLGTYPKATRTAECTRKASSILALTSKCREWQFKVAFHDFLYLCIPYCRQNHTTYTVIIVAEGRLASLTLMFEYVYLEEICNPVHIRFQFNALLPSLC